MLLILAGDAKVLELEMTTGAAKTDEGFQQYLEEFVLEAPAEAAE